MEKQNKKEIIRSKDVWKERRNNIKLKGNMEIEKSLLQVYVYIYIYIYIYIMKLKKGLKDDARKREHRLVTLALTVYLTNIYIYIYIMKSILNSFQKFMVAKFVSLWAQA